MKNKKIKIVQIISDSDLSGGPRHVLGILNHLNRNIFQPYLICPEGDLSSAAKKLDSMFVYNVGMSSKFSFLAVLRIFSVLKKIEKQKNTDSPLVAHVHGIRAGFLSRLIIPKGVKIVYTEHLYDANYHLDNHIYEYIQKGLIKILNSKADAIIAVSNSVKDYLIQSHLGQEQKVQVVPNAIDVDSENLRSKLLLKKRKNFVVGTVGNLNKQKGHTFLIKSMPKILEKYPDLNLKIVGEGQQRKTLETLISNLGLNNHVFLLGKSDNVSEILKSFDVFVLSSISETFGIVLLEAMNAGVPVVATSVGGIGDIVEDGKNGLLVKSHNSDNLAEAIIYLLENPSVAFKFRTEGFKTIGRFSWKNVISQIEDIYFAVSAR